MFNNLLKIWQETQTSKALLTDPIYKMVSAYIAKNLHTYDVFEDMPDDQRQTIVTELLDEISEVLLSQDKFMANRNKIVSYVLTLAHPLVLVIHPKTDDEDDPSDLIGKPGITGELKEHLLKLADKDEWLINGLGDLDNLTKEDVYAYCWGMTRIYQFKLDLFNLIRIYLGDYQPDSENREDIDKDWFRRFIAIQCAYEEHQIRKKLGLPEVLDDIEVLKLGVLYKFVTSDAKDPVAEWQRHFGDSE